MDIHLRADPVSTAARVHERAVSRYGAENVSFLRQYLEEVYLLAPLAGLCPDWLAAQSSHETDYWRSPAWIRTGNPAGIGITDGTDHGYTFKTGTIAARAQIVHMAGYVFGRIVPPVLASFVILDPRWDALMASGRAGSVRTVDDLGNGNWATDPVYPAGLKRHHAALIQPAPQTTPAPIPSPPGGSTVALKITRQMIPPTNPNFPGSLLSPGLLYITVHETGNTRVGAFAQQEANFLKSGGGSSNVAFHFAVDHLGAFQCLPLNRIGWHAGDGCDSRAQDIGCFASIAIETCVGNNNQYKDATRANLLKLIAAIVTGDTQIDFGGTDPKQFSTQRVAPHQRWSSYQKECPTFMLRDGYMWTIIAKATALIADVIPTIPAFAAPSPIPELVPYRSGDPNQIPYRVSLPDGTTCVFVGDRVRAVRETPRMRFSEGTEIVGPVLKKDEEFAVDWLLIHPDREDTYYSPFGTRIKAKDTARVADIRDVIAA